MHLIHDVRDEMRARGAKLIQLTPGLDPTTDPESGEAAEGAPKPTDQDKALLKQLQEAEPMVGGRIKDEVLWACVTCGACEAVCPVFIEHPQKIVEMRTHLVLAESRIPTELARIFKGLENNQNPWGIGSDKRMDWAEGLDVPIMADKGKAEYLVWIGCAGSYDDRAKKISRAWVQLLQRAGVDFAILGLEEGCTGDAARRAGNEFLFQTLAEANVELFKGYEVKKIIVTCPHCYHSFKNEYPQFGGNYEVWHHTQFLRKLIAEGKLKPEKTNSDPMTYHDSCYLGRWNEVYDAPRDVIAATSGGRRPIEMARTGYKSFCCGAGGARMWMEEAQPRINENRTKEALGTGAKTIATACPYCIVMISDGVKAANKEEEVRVLDVAEVLLDSLPPAAITATPPVVDKAEAQKQPPEAQA
jgi:Fe-S oxidoreductase